MDQLRILVVDDEQDVEALFAQKFRKQVKDGKFEINYVSSAADAIKFVEENGVDNLAMVLSDINMPAMDGLELLKILKDEHNDLKVIMVTAYGDEKNFKEAMRLGADEFFNKPVNFDLLQKKIEEMFL
ncbi:MAG: response regulator [Bacteroidia bacterium]|nr:response regulator [Bacteroidia bacterium]